VNALTLTRYLSRGSLALTVIVAALGLNLNTHTLASSQATITIEQPDGVEDVVGEGDDFATTVLGNPWDLSQPSDLLGRHHLPAGYTVSGGELGFTTDSDRTTIKILFAGKEGMVDIGYVGMNYPIDTSTYRWLSFRMYHQYSGEEYSIKWFYGRYGDSDRAWAATYKYPAEEGWHTYVIDLENAPIQGTSGGATGWNGSVPELTIVSHAPAGREIRLDWVRLTADNPVDNNLDISWSGLSPVPSQLQFFLDTDASGCDGPLMGTDNSPSASGTFNWQQAADGVFSPSNVAPGDYYVCAKADGSLAGYSSGQLTVNQSPVFRFTQPSFTSGDDFATDAGNPWDMNDAADIDHVVQGEGTVSGGVLDVSIPSSAVDTQVHLNVPTDIDSSHYHYLSYRIWFDYPYSTSAVGQNNRVFWGRKPVTEATSELIYVYPGWMTYTIDLRSFPLHSGPNWLTKDWNIFRIDPIGHNKTGQRVHVYMDTVLLTSDEEADKHAEITWSLDDPDTSVTTMTLYYDTNQSGWNGTHIATLSLTDGEQVGRASASREHSVSIRATNSLTYTVYFPTLMRNYITPCSGSCYTWSTIYLPADDYYLYACIDDGFNVFCRYSETPVYVSH
jgi:hypothetical protein